MKLIKALTFLLTLVLAIPTMAQEPVVGVADPESLFTDANPQLHANKQVVLHVMRELLQCNHWGDAGNWISDRYLQHNPNVGSGLAPVVAFFSSVSEPNPDCEVLTTPVVAVTAADDLVTVMIAREFDNPRQPGTTYTTTWYDTWRIVNGKADEHWDPATIAAP
jgi:predicted SnoaL-like aldol condensation-catalyzing enzyme